MSKHIYIDVAAKVPTVSGCIKLSPNLSYEDFIIKNFDYTGETQKNISFTNYCSTNLVVPEFVIFTDNSNNGDFEAKINSFNILAGQSLNVPVHYFGTHRSDITPKNYNINFNGISANYKLNISIPIVNTPPEIENITFLLDNGEGKVFSLEDFVTHYSDAESDALDAVILEGDVSHFRLNAQPIVSGQQIPVNLIAAGLFQLLPQITNEKINIVVSLKVKDEAGSTSI